MQTQGDGNSDCFFCGAWVKSGEQRAYITIRLGLSSTANAASRPENLFTTNACRMSPPAGSACARRQLLWEAKIDDSHGIPQELQPHLARLNRNGAIRPPEPNGRLECCMQPECEAAHVECLKSRVAITKLKYTEYKSAYVC